MIRRFYASTFLLITATAVGVSQPVNRASGSPASQLRVGSTFFFEGQEDTPENVSWEARGAAFEASFSRDTFVIRMFGTKPYPVTKPATDAGVLPAPRVLPDPERISLTEQRVTLVGANPKARIEALDRLPGRVNFFRGNDPARWQRGLATFARLRYKNIYPGIDLVFYSNEGALEYDFVVAPGADPRSIRMRVENGRSVRIDEAGVLRVGDGAETVVHRPLLYQNLASGKKRIEGKFVSLTDNTVGFQFSQYDPRRTLVIDPTLSLLYSTYLGGPHDDESTALAVDPQGNTFILGWSGSTTYPVSGNAYQPQRALQNSGLLINNMVLTKISPSGILLYSTFLGGSTGETSGAIALDAAGNAYLTGASKSTDYPVTGNAYQGTYPSGAASSVVVSEISPDGSALLYSTFFGGSGGSTATAAQGLGFHAGSLYFTGSAGPGLPTTSGAYLTQINSGQAAFVAALNLAAAGPAQLVAATYYGVANPLPNSSTTGNLSLGMVLDSSGNPWITGQTYTNTLPTTTGALQPAIPTLSTSCQTSGSNLNSAAFIAKLSSNLKNLLYGSYLSGQTTGAQVNAACSEYAHAIALDSSGNVYLAGATASASFPTTSGALQSSFPGSNNYVGFISKLSADGTQKVWSSYIGGNGGYTFPTWLSIDTLGNPWVGGLTQGGSNFPISSPTFQNTQNGTFNGFLTEFNTTGAQASFSTYIGGSMSDQVQAFEFDAQNNVYVAGNATSRNFPVTANALQPIFANGTTVFGGGDVFFLILGTGSISGAVPASGGNSGDTTVTISGAGFEAGATCELMQGSTAILASNVAVSSSGATITCTFPLNGAIAGVYNIVVTNPNGNTTTDKNAFTVTSGGQPNVWTTLTGRATIRVGIPSQMTLNYGNTGTANAYMTTIWLVLPAAYTYSISGLTALIDSNCVNVNNAPTAIAKGNFNYIPILVPSIPAGSVNSLAITVTAPTLATGLELHVYAEQPWFNSLSEANATFSAAIASPASVPAACVSTGAGVASCLGQFSVEVGAVILAELSAEGKADLSAATDTTVQLATVLQSLLSGSAGASSAYSSVAVITQVGADLLQRLFSIGNACSSPGFIRISGYVNPPPAMPNITLTCPDDVDELGFGADFLDGDDPCFPQDDNDSDDPNDKTGPSGDNSANRYVRAVSPFTYNVSFENQATATLPAAQVVVTDPIDPTKFNLATVALGTISFGTNMIQLPPNTNNFNVLFPINSSLSVRIQGSLNADTGALKWTFTSIDPTTGLPPTDPTIGFLPPDTDGVKGQGSVTFTVSPQHGLTTGIQIMNQATVVFDANSPILTPTWLNTIDVSAPTSSVAALSSTESTVCINISWSGMDVGSGVRSYSIFVSDNGAGYTPYLSQTTSTSATFVGQAGHTYRFYSVATDRAGNVESKSTADTSTTVNANATSCSTTLGQTISFGALSPEPLGMPPVAITAAASSGLPVTFTSNSASFCTVAGHAVTLIEAGTCSITASQSGNVAYAAAAPITQVFAILASGSGSPTLLAPANGAANVSLAPPLTWSATSGATSYDIYFGTTPTPPFVVNTTSTSYTPGTVQASTTYYWQVVAKSASVAASSAIWSFTTGTVNSGNPPFAVSPASGHTANQVLTYTFTGSSGYQNLGVMDVLINNAINGIQACYVAFVPSSATSGSLFLVDDAGDAGGPYSGMVLPGNGSVQNSQCSISGTGSSVAASGNTLTLTLNVTFNAAFAGNKVIYMAAQGNGPGWQGMGAWDVPGGAGPVGPAVSGMNPARSSTASQTYTFTFTDSNGWQDIGVTDILINSAIDGRHACYLAFVPSGTSAGSVLLVDDAGDAGGPYSGLVLPGSGTVQNSQCTINATGSSVTASGNTLTLTLAMSFSQAFAGDQIFFVAARNNTLNSNWQPIGSISVP